MGSAYFDPESKLLVLDLLVDGPGSFVSIYGELTRFHGFPPDVNLLMNHLEAHEADGHIELLRSLGGGNLVKPTPEDRSRAREQYQDVVRKLSDDFTTDEIGFWYFLTPIGRDVWGSMSATQRDEQLRVAPWVIQEDVVEGVLVVCARTRREAEAALQKLCVNTPGRTIDFESAAVEDIESFRLANGREVRPAVRLTVRYAPGARDL